MSHGWNEEVTIGQYENYKNASDYDLGVIDGTKDLTFEEAVTCGFSDPYSADVTFDPLKKLFKLRRERLVSEGVL